MKGNVSTCNTPRKPTGPGINSQLARTSIQSKKTACDIFGGNNLSTSTTYFDQSFDDGIKPFECDEAKFFATPTKNSFTYSSPSRNSTPLNNDSLCSKSGVSQYSFDRISTNSPQASPISQIKSGEKTSFKKSYNSSSLCLSDFMSPSTSKVKPRKITKENVLKSENSSILSESEFPAIGKRTPKSSQKNISSSTSINNSKDDSNNVTPIKPRKRVAPVTIKTTAENNFGSIAYRTDNNLLDINNDDTKISRDLLKTQIDAIAKEFENESLPDRAIHFYGQFKHQNDSGTSAPVQIDFMKVTQVDVLNRMIRIYTFIIDSNLTTNCLSEISFLLNLLNAEFIDHFPHQQQLSTFEESSTVVDASVDELIEPHLINRQCHISSSMIFKNIHNCVYFSAGVLSKQKHLLMLLDITTIKVLLENERLMEHGECMKKFLTNVYTHKLQLDSVKCSSHDVSFKQGGGNNVFYQEDDDTKEHFPSMREFSTFKHQRDGFYNVLRIWESNHFNPSWNFAIELGHKIRSLLAVMRHPINMTHMAKLFTSQLILSCNFEDTSSDLQQALPQIDPSKLSKLQQRLIAPSYFATDYMYPGAQSFFRDFLTAADSEIIFIEQLKIVLINELLELNDSSYETLRLSSTNKKSPHFDEYVVRPETVATMRVLAKFLGLIYVKPFAYDGTRNLGVDSRQIDLRNMAYPLFDMKGILKKSIDDRRLIVTIPWMVQFLSMLDYVTLRLNYFLDILRTLFELYITATDVDLHQKENQIRPTSLFILKTCLGWLFEQPNIPIDEYYKYRQSRLAIQPPNEMSLVQVLVPKSLSDYFNNKKFMITNHQISLHFNTMQCTLETIDAKPDKHSSLSVASFGQHSIDRILSTLDPMMENILISACPFLRDFRVSIMPLKYSKTVSRSGKYRHITTKTTAESKFTKDAQDQTKLAEAFLQSQSLSVRRTIEFVIERTVSAVIKDFQIEILIPTKKQVNEEISTINETEKRKLANGMYERYHTAQLHLNKKWDDVMPVMIRERVKKALDALLPNETLAIVKQTCTNLAVQKCKLKTTEWKNLNLVGIDFFTKDLSGDANKIIKTRNLFGKQPNVLHFHFGTSQNCPSNMLSQLQIELHCISMTPERVSLSKIESLINDLTNFLNTGVLPSSICKTICLSTLNLVLLLVCNRPDLIQHNALNRFIKLWNCNGLEYWTKRIEDNDNENSKEPPNLPTYIPIETRHVFSNIINNCLMHKLANCSSMSFQALEHFLMVLVNENFLTIPILNEQFVTLLRVEWPEDVLQQISHMISNVVSATTNGSNDPNECLFMEMLSDLSKDIFF